jgi:hypothetical protein
MHEEEAQVFVEGKEDIAQRQGGDEIQTKVLRVFLLVIHSHLYSFA